MTERNHRLRKRNFLRAGSLWASRRRKTLEQLACQHHRVLSALVNVAIVVNVLSAKRFLCEAMNKAAPVAGRAKAHDVVVYERGKRKNVVGKGDL